MAGKIPREFIDNLISRVDLVDLIDARVPLKKAGVNFQARCPFHNEKSPSFSVNREKQVYYCFGCGAKGNAITFLMEYERLTFVEAIESLAGSIGLEVPRESGHSDRERESEIRPLYQIQEQAADFYARQLTENPHSAQARSYLKHRGLTEETIHRFHLGYAPPGWQNLPESMNANLLLTSGLAIAREGSGHYDRFRDRIMFPIRDRRGRVIGFGGRVLGDEKPKYLNSPESPTFKKSREVYGLHELLSIRQRPERILVVEGYMDVIALAQHEIPYAVATLGTATSYEHAELLFRYTRELVFCFDGDAAGRNAAWKALDTSLPAIREGRSIRFLMLPEEHDPDSLVRETGKQAFENLIAESQPLSEFFFRHLSQEIDLQTIEGRASLLQNARPLIGKLPEGVFRDLMEQKLKALSGQDKPPPKKPSPTPSIRTGRNPPSILRIVLALLIQNPGFIHLIGSDAEQALEGDPKAGVLAKKLFAMIREKPAISTAGILERFRGEAENAMVSALSVLKLFQDDSHDGTGLGRSASESLNSIESLQAEFSGALGQYLNESRQHHLERLLAKMSNARLEKDELEELRKLTSKN